VRLIDFGFPVGFQDCRFTRAYGGRDANMLAFLRVFWHR
jgi:hypothetical protein